MIRHVPRAPERTRRSPRSRPTRNSTNSPVRSATSSSPPCSETGGHLGSNLGAVELSLALHRVFESPTDAILWDTGHQAYVHKIVTGRKPQFEQLRQAGGLSGYPEPRREPHDHIENSHASTVLLLRVRHGGRPRRGVDDHRHIVAVIGDGAMTGGMAYEALNNLGHSKRRVIIVLNDNGRSYAPTVSNLSANTPGRRRACRTTRASPTSSPTSWPTRSPTSVSTRSTCAASAASRSSSRDLPGVGHQAENGDGRRSRPACASSSSRRRSSRRSACATSARSTATTSTRWRPRFRNADRAVGRGPDRRARAHPEGPRLLPRRGRRREAPPRRAGVRPAPSGRPRRCRRDTPRRSPRRSSRRPRPTPRIVAITAAMPGPTGLLPFQERFPDRFFDVGHRRAARGHRCRRHGDVAGCGRSSRSTRRSSIGPGTRSSTTSRCTGSRSSSASIGPASPAPTAPATTACTTWRCCRRCRACGCSHRRAPRSSQQMLHDALTLADDGPVAIRYPRRSRLVRSANHEVGVGPRRPATSGRGDGSVCVLAVGQDARVRPQGRRRAGRRRHRGRPSGTCAAARRSTPT